MAFDLIIAMSRDPMPASEPPSAAARARTAVFAVRGAFSNAGAAELAHRMEALFDGDCSIFVVWLEWMDDVNPEALSAFARWLKERRDENLDLRIGAEQPAVHAVLTAIESLRGALVASPDGFREEERRHIVTHNPHSADAEA